MQISDGIYVNFIENGGEQIINLPNNFLEYTHMRISYVTLNNNYFNIKQEYGNSKLYLNTSGSVFIDLPDGNYDINDINERNLIGVIGGLYYKILSDPDGFWIYSFLNTTDRQQNTNGTAQNPSLTLNNGLNLNKELKDGLFWTDYIQLNSQVIDTHGNYLNLNNQNTTTKTNNLIIPIDVNRNETTTFEIQELIFDVNINVNQLRLLFYFTDKLNWKIYFKKNNCPKVLILFLWDEEKEHQI